MQVMGLFRSKGTIEKIVMGAIIGTAIGSVVGLSMAPKSGKETREFLKEKYEANKDLEEAKKLTRETFSGIGRMLKKLIFGGKSQKSSSHDAGREHRPLREIPNEGEEVVSRSTTELEREE